MPSMDVTGLKNAIHTWIRTTSGLSADRVLWEGQPAPEASGNAQAWISIGRFSWTNPGGDWSEYAPNPLVFADKPFTLNATTNQLAITAHGLTSRSGPVRLTTTGSLVGTGLATATDYWVIVDDANNIKLATTFANADDGVFIDILDVGTGTHSLVDTAQTVKAGEELIEYVRGARRVTFDVTCFPPLPTTDATEAAVILSDVSAKSGLGSIAGALQAANIGLLDPGQPRLIAGVQNSVYFEPRAVMTVVFTTTSEVSGTETIIDYVGVDQDPGTRDFTVSVPQPPAIVIERDGPQNTMEPITLDQWLAVDGGWKVPAYLARGQESAAPLVDDVQGATMGVSGSPLYRQTLAGWGAKWLRTAETAGEGFFASAGAWWNTNTQSVLYIFRFRLVSLPGGLRVLAMLSGAGAYVSVNSSGVLQLRNTSFIGTGTYNYNDGAEHFCAVEYICGAGVLGHTGPGLFRLSTDKEQFSTTWELAPDDRKGLGACGLGGSTAPPAWYGRQEAWVGSDAERMSATGIKPLMQHRGFIVTGY